MSIVFVVVQLELRLMPTGVHKLSPLTGGSRGAESALFWYLDLKPESS